MVTVMTCRKGEGVSRSTKARSRVLMYPELCVITGAAVTATIEGIKHTMTAQMASARSNEPVHGSASSERACEMAYDAFGCNRNILYSSQGNVCQLL